MASKISWDATVGINFSTRTEQAILAGGFPADKFESDVRFGERLSAYAAENGGHVKTIKHDRRFEVRSTFRISERTGSSLAPLLKSLRAGEDIEMEHPLTGEMLLLNAETYDRLWSEMAEINRQGIPGIAYRHYVSEYGNVTRLP